VAPVDTRIDELFAGPLAEFTAARNALAKTLTGDAAKRVKSLRKPTVVAWAINQLYWHGRRLFDRVVDTGERVRKSQIAALEGKPVDVREATSAHRDAIAAAVKEAERLAARTGSHPSPDALMRTLEALSLSPTPPEPFGRLTDELQPAGFEALLGISPKAGALRHPTPSSARPRSHEAAKRPTEDAAALRAAAAAEARRFAAEEKQREAEARRREADIRKAEAALARAQAAERMAHDAWLRAQTEVDEARQRLTRAKTG
jgi:hypothetical protein